MKCCAYIGIRTPLSLDELATLLSEQLCGGIRFGGQDENLREEVPALYTQNSFLGLRMVVYGSDGEFGLDVEQWEELNIKHDEVDISQCLLVLLARVEGLSAYLINEG